MRSRGGVFPAKPGILYKFVINQPDVATIPHSQTFVSPTKMADFEEHYEK